MNDCLFCGIANDPTKLIWQSQFAAAFDDIHPKAPVHILLVPKAHIGSLDDLDDAELAAELLLAVREVAHKAGLKGAYRTLLNTGRSAGQSVDHLHFHILGGQVMSD